MSAVATTDPPPLAQSSDGPTEESPDGRGSVSSVHRSTRRAECWRLPVAHRTGRIGTDQPRRRHAGVARGASAAASISIKRPSPTSPRTRPHHDAARPPGGPRRPTTAPCAPRADRPPPPERSVRPARRPRRASVGVGSATSSDAGPHRHRAGVGRDAGSIDEQRGTHDRPQSTTPHPTRRATGRHRAHRRRPETGRVRAAVSWSRPRAGSPADRGVTNQDGSMERPPRPRGRISDEALRSAHDVRSPADLQRLSDFDQRIYLPLVFSAIVPIVLAAGNAADDSGVSIAVNVVSWLVFIVDLVVHVRLIRHYLRSPVGIFDLVVVIITAPWFLIPGFGGSQILVVARLARLLRLLFVSKGARAPPAASARSACSPWPCWCSRPGWPTSPSTPPTRASRRTAMPSGGASSPSPPSGTATSSRSRRRGGSQGRR